MPLPGQGRGRVGRAQSAPLLSEMISVMIPRIVSWTLATLRSAVHAASVRSVAVVLAAASVLLAAGAAEPSTAGAAPTAPVRVVAAENVWGTIAAQIGGRAVVVTSLLTNPNADPHLFQIDARDAATLTRARVVIENGAGYDDWMRALLAADGGHPAVVDAASVLGLSGHDPNPHLWYDIPRVPRVAAAIAAALAGADPGHAATFRRNLRAFDASLVPLDTTLAAIGSHHAGAPVAYTERVPGYLLADAGLVVRTPVGFAMSVEDGNDPGPADTLAMRRLLTTHRVDVLLYNTQTVTPVTAQMRALARQHGIPVVGVSETMPARAGGYQRWQRAQLDALVRALGEHGAP